MFAEHGYVKMMLTVIAACLIVLTAERLLRGKVDFYACGGRSDPCHAVIDEDVRVVGVSPARPSSGGSALDWFNR